MSGVFTISLDFELHWGGFEKWPLKPQVGMMRHQGVQGKDYIKYFLNTREAIPEMLRLFQEYEVHVTWAAVGMLLNSTRRQLLENAPSIRPTYRVMELSAYRYIDVVGIGDDETSDPFHYAPSLVSRILETPNQELGTHTYAHFYCNEEGQTLDQFRADLQAAKRAASLHRVDLKSLVFPRNQFNADYLRICFEEGITSVRSNPKDWFWSIQGTQSEPKFKRLMRGLDAYLPVGTTNTYKLTQIAVQKGLPFCLPASRLLRPYRPAELILNEFKIRRIINELSRAAKNHEVYHLWWHPHNFGFYPEQSLDGLKKILNHYRACRRMHGMISMNMRETADWILTHASN